jgi:hypothetical protein
MLPIELKTGAGAVLLALVLASLACSFPLNHSGELPDDGPPLEVSRQSAASFVSKILESGRQAATSQTVRFTITEQEATSALHYASELAAFSQGGPLFEGLEQFNPGALENQELPPEAAMLRDLGEALGDIGGNQPSNASSNPLNLQVRLEQPQVRFLGSGEMILRGYGRISTLRLPLRVVLTPTIQEGQINFDFVEGQLGSLPLPALLFDPLGVVIGRALTAGQDYAQITVLSVTEGALTFAGQISLNNLPGN